MLHFIIDFTNNSTTHTLMQQIVAAAVAVALVQYYQIYTSTKGKKRPCRDDLHITAYCINYAECCTSHYNPEIEDTAL